MQNYPAPAQALVAEMSAACAADPARAVAFQGAPGANSHLAALETFPNGLPLPCFSFEDALDAVRDFRADHAVIPIENSLHGRVADMHFLLPESGLVIIGEHFMHIRHTMMALPHHGQITQVMSHPQALGQCRHYLRANGITPISYPDTAGAAAAVAEAGDPHVAALAPSIAAGIYGLKVVKDDLSDGADNTTRFVVLAREAQEVPLGSVSVMTTFIFEVKNIPAALYKALGGFATNGVNMTKLESYQRGASFAATEFYADIEGHPDEPHVRRALEELAFHTKWVRLLGTYPQARERIIG
ncbi:prephenate dehydratase [Sphingomonas sp. Root710]|uniref:prephenate dehydratase n=1 Tax=Sphingomonas sp. Root710 TaxID=1736594 RepID=UPI0007016A0E|nr:prephenate dehydratase [Sphingomonas sp. Root710]KRB85432.1 prephenate dehydratase [Sphingomonas sp. Root710]